MIGKELDEDKILFFQPLFQIKQTEIDGLSVTQTENKRKKKNHSNKIILIEKILHL